MKLSLPFTYSITHQKPGQGKPTTSGAISRVSADIPRVKESAVELAAEWTEPSNGRTIRKTVVSWNGDLYRKLGITIQLLTSENPSTLASLNRDDAMKRLYGNSYWGSVRSRQLQNAFSGEDTPRAIPKSRIVTSTTLDHDRGEAQHMIDGIISIEGEAWHRIPGIMLSLYQASERDASLSITTPPYGHEKDELLTGMSGIQNPVFTRFFDINEQIRALSHADDEDLVQRRFYGLKIHRPDLVAFDAQSEFAARIMNSAVRTNDYRVGEMGDREIFLWMRMRDAVAGWYGIPSVPFGEEDLDALYEFCSLTPKAHMNQWPRRGCEILDTYRTHAPAPVPKAGMSRQPQ